MSEYAQFVGVTILFAAILLGSCWFVLYSPEAMGRREEQRRTARERGNG